MEHYEKRVLVDLTPVLKGGTNGGAKVFVIELLKKFIEKKPNYCWIFVIRPSLKEELSCLKADNVAMIIEQRIINDDFFHRLIAKGHRYLKKNPLVPFFVIFFLKKIVNDFLEKRKYKKLMLDNYDLLFCPFTAPIYHRENIPTVSVIYDLQYKTFPFFFSPEDANQRHASFIDTCQKSTKLITISEYARGTILKHGKVSPEDVKAIHLALASRLSIKSNKRYLKKLGLKEKKYFIYPANFWQHKNHEMLITAFEIAKSQGIDKHIKLVFTGAPCERQAMLKKVVEQKKLSNTIFFLDYISNDDLACLMANSLALVFPSLYEGFGIPVVEAMSLNVPILCSHLTSLPEVAADAALYFNPRNPIEIANAILEIKNNEMLRQNLIEKGKQRLVNFVDINKMAEDYLDVFDAAIYKSHQDDYLVGLFEDNWIGERLIMNVGKHELNNFVEFEFVLPDFIKQSIKLVVNRFCFSSKKQEIDEFVIESGEKKIIKYDLTQMGSKFSIRSNFSFKPSNLLKDNMDHRVLSLKLINYQIDRYY